MSLKDTLTAIADKAANTNPIDILLRDLDTEDSDTLYWALRSRKTFSNKAIYKALQGEAVGASTKELADAYLAVKPNTVRIYRANLLKDSE